jgi:hypothetical protein
MRARGDEEEDLVRLARIKELFLLGEKELWKKW